MPLYMDPLGEKKVSMKTWVQLRRSMLWPLDIAGVLSLSLSLSLCVDSGLEVFEGGIRSRYVWKAPCQGCSMFGVRNQA